MRGKMRLESGLRWARLSFTDLVNDRQAIFIVPDELMPGSVPRWVIENGVFTNKQLLGITDLAGHQTKRKREGGSSSTIRQKSILQEANGRQE